MSAQRILFIRHAESTWNVERRWQGQADPPLSEAGRVQAESLAETLEAEALRLDLLAASDLARARQTAETLGRRLSLPVRLEPRLRELDVGCWSGLRPEEVAEREPETLARLRRSDRGARPAGGESWGEFVDRVHGAVRGLAAASPGAALAVVSHLGVLRALQPGAKLENTGRIWIEVPGEGRE